MFARYNFKISCTLKKRFKINNKKYNNFKAAKIFFIISFLFVCCNDAFANPEPLGIKLNIDTISKVKEKYIITKTTQHFVEGYSNNAINIEGSDLEGMLAVEISTNEKEIVEAIAMFFNMDRFDELFSTLKSKYKISNSEFSPGRDKFVEFTCGDCLILLADNPKYNHVSVIYTTRKLVDKNAAQNKKKIKSEIQKIKKIL